MVSSIIGTTYILEQLAKAIYGLRSEIAIFIFAFIGHAFFFGRYRLQGKPAKLAKKKSTDKNSVDSCSNDNVPSGNSSNSAHAALLVAAADSICRGINAEDVAAKLTRRLKETPVHGVAPAMLALLQHVGRTPSVQLLDAVPLVLKKHALPLNPQLGEMLLRGYFNQHQMEKFNDVLTSLEASCAASGARLDVGVALQALKGALRNGDFEASMTRLEGIQQLWRTVDTSCSSAPNSLIQWLSRLAIQKGALQQLLLKLQALALLPETFILVLSECVQRNDPEALRNAEAFGRAQRVPFTDGIYCLLLRGSRDAEAALRFFNEAVDSVPVTKELLIAAGEVATLHRSAALAGVLVKNLPQTPPVEAIGNVLQVFNSIGGHSELLNIYWQHFRMVDLSIDPVSEALIASACISLTRFDVLKSMLATTDDSTKRVPLIKHFSVAKRLDDAFVIFRTCTTKGSCLYNTVIDACVDSGRPELAQDVLREAIQAGVADTVTYNTMIKAQLLAGKTREAHDVVEMMKGVGLQPNCATFNELLDACVQSKSSDHWILVDEMKACGMKPNNITCSILLKTIQSNSSAENVGRIFDVLDSMVDEMDEVLLSSVIEALMRVGRVDLLAQHLKRQGSVRKVRVRGSHTYGSIIRAFGYVNDVEGAWETWREMRRRRIVPSSVTLGCMVEAVVANGDTEGGYELIQDMLNDEQCRTIVNAVIYCSVLKGFSHQKSFDRLWTVYQEMLVQKVVFSSVTFNTLVDACSRCAEMNRIPYLLQSMVSQGIEPNLITYSAILKGYCQENRLDEAFELLEGMLQTTRFKPDEIMYNTLLDGCARQGYYDRGMKLLGEMENEGIRPSCFTLSVLVKMASRAKRLDRAFSVCDEISTKYRIKLNIHVYSNLIQACIVNKDLGRAFDVLERLVKDRIRLDVRTYTLLLRGSVSAGQAADAAGLLRAAVGLRGVHPRLLGCDAKLLQPQAGLPQAVLSEVLMGISGAPCYDEVLAVSLLRDLRAKPSVKLDPKLQLRLTTHAMGTTRK